MSTMMATRSWLPHRAFDYESARDRAPEGAELCPGTLHLHDPEAPVVLAACDTCSYEAGVRQRDLAVEEPETRPDRWWDR